MNTQNPQLIEPNEVGQFDLSDKALVVMFAEFTARQIDGEFVPKYEVVAAAFGINKQLVQEWWLEKDKIQATMGHSMDILPTIISSKLKMMTFSAIEEVNRRGLETFSNKELISFIKEAVQITRLLDGKSTGNLSINQTNNLCDGHISALVKDIKEIK